MADSPQQSSASNEHHVDSLHTAVNNQETMQLQRPKAAASVPRISKENLFALMAFWMERCPLNGDDPPYQVSIVPKPNKPEQFGVNKAGAVFVNKNDKIVAMDCSRKRKDGVQVHAAARVLIKFPDKVKGCTVYMSRKPCSFCVKLLVQAEVSRIRFLPFQPEASPDTKCDDLENAKRTENLLRICPIGLSVCVPDLDILETTDFDKHVIDIFEAEYWTKRWEQELKEMEEGSERDIMRCSGLSDPNVIDTVKDRMIEVGKWIARITNKLKNGTTFELFNETLSVSIDHHPLPAFWEELYLHMSRMSLIASQQTDDPGGGVGVTIMREEEVVSAGVSGYPSKALFGDFPRKNKRRSAGTPSNKHPFLIHAEQNVLMTTNTRVIPDSETTAFITKPPCNYCMCLLLEAGVSKIVLPVSEDERLSDYVPNEGYAVFNSIISNQEDKVMVFGIAT